MYHSFDTDFAKQYGLLEAILINHFYFWISKNKANDRNFHDGKYWTYNTMKAFAEMFPYVSHKKIERALNHLKDSGVIVTGNYNSESRDRTLWYTFTDDFGKCISQVREMEFPPVGNVISNSNRNTDYINNADYKGVKPTQSMPPTLEAVKEYYHSKGISDWFTDDDVERFFDYYESNGWRQSNGLKITKWKNAFNNWVNREKRYREERKPKQQAKNNGFDFDQWMKDKEAEGAFDD